MVILYSYKRRNNGKTKLQAGEEMFKTSLASAEKLQTWKKLIELSAETGTQGLLRGDSRF